MNKLHKSLIGAVATIAAVAAPLISFAQAPNPFNTAQTQLNGIATNAGVSATQTLPSIVGRIINVVFGFLGIIILFYFLYAGFLWMIAGGDEKQVQKAKDMMKNAVIGVIVVVAALSISNFVLTNLVNITQG